MTEATEIKHFSLGLAVILLTIVSGAVLLELRGVGLGIYTIGILALIGAGVWERGLGA